MSLVKALYQNLLPECTKTRIFSVILQIFSEHAPGPPYNGFAFGTLHNIDLWRHSATKL